MLLSVYLPHSGRDEKDYIEALETVRCTLTEERKAAAVDFFLGGDLSIEFRLDNTDGDFQSFNRIERQVMYGPECRGGGRGFNRL